MVLSILFPHISTIFATLILISAFLKWNKPGKPILCLRKLRKCAEIVWKYAESTISEEGNHCTKFHIKIRKPHFKLRKALFIRVNKDIPFKTLKRGVIKFYNLKYLGNLNWKRIWMCVQSFYLERANMWIKYYISIQDFARVLHLHISIYIFIW